MQGLEIAGHELDAWAVGLTLTLVFLDLGPGFTRDHPPFGRRIAGGLVGLLSVLAVACFAVHMSQWLAILVTAPFAVIGSWYSWCWCSDARASLRRSVGRQCAIVGGLSLLVLMLSAGPQNWNGGVVMGMYGASVGVLGGLTFMLLRAWTEDGVGLSALSEVTVDVPVRVALVGLGVGALAGLQVIWATLMGTIPRELPVWAWPALTLVAPVLLLTTGSRLFPGRHKLLWALALLCAMSGQALIHAMSMTHPGLIPAAAL